MPRALPTDVVDALATRDARMSHLLWHTSRNAWHKLSPQAAADFEARYPGWAPPRPRYTPAGTSDYANHSGEDFLYMHRHMINKLNKLLEGRAEYPRVEGWRPIPRPGDRDYPVPYLSGNDIEDKSDAYFNRHYIAWEHQFTDRTYLCKLTLGELGSRLEELIHDSMHRRWAADTCRQIRPLGHPPEPHVTCWDHPEYDFLGDAYSSHVNEVFWRIHGWIDDRIEDWARAKGVRDIQWKGTWLGPMQHEHAHGHHPSCEAGLTRLMQLGAAIKQIDATGKAGFWVHPDM